MSQHIYKIAHIRNNVIIKIYIYMGYARENLEKTDEQLKKMVVNGDMKDIISESLRDKIKKEDIDLKFINTQIFLDDTIETIKKKIMMNLDNKISFGEIYLFAKQLQNLDPVTVYQNLTQNGKLDLTKYRLLQFISNIEELADKSYDYDNDVYDYDDILSLNLSNKAYPVDTPIGQKFSAVEKFPFVVNPYNVIMYDPFLAKNVEGLLTTTNKNLLMNSGEIEDNIIYMCSAEETLEYSKTPKGEWPPLLQEDTIKIYFPYLLENEINSLDMLLSKKEELLANSENLIDENFRRTVDNIDLFHDIFYEKISELPYKEIGIKSVNLLIHQAFTFNLPLDVVFKLIHASETVPLIKYNPGKRQEKIYRLYADKIATNGKKIPFLNKSQINKLIKDLAKEKKVSLYIQQKIDYNMVSLICEFNNDGTIGIKTELPFVMKKNELDKFIQDTASPAINVVKDYLAQSGYAMNNFTSITDKYIELVDLKYSFVIPITKPMKFPSIIGCVSSIFSITSDNINEGAIMRFKRVANYNEMDSMEAFIIELAKSGDSQEEIIMGLMKNFNLKEAEARTKFAEFVSSLQLAEGAFQGRKLKIKNNPGFLTIMTKEAYTNNLIISISGINNIEYLKTIPIYIDSLLRITQFPKSTKILQSSINTLCKSSEIKKAEEVEDIVAPSEYPHQAPVIEGNELHFEEPDETSPQKDMFDLFLSDMEDEDDEEDDDEDDGLEAEGIEESAGDNPEDLVPSPNKGGANTPENELEVDITGKSLNNPNPFSERLNKRESNLFMVEEDGGYRAYSRMCPWNARRQPVILTDSEKEKIDKEHPGSYDEAVKYGSDKDKQFWYICPRYWSLKEGVSLTEEQAKSGKYGTIIPPNAKKVPPGGGVFEFASKDGEHLYPSPGFLKPSSHPKGKCFPCCFKSWTSPEQKRRRDICAKEMEGEKDIKSKKPKEVIDDYVLGFDKFPLEQRRYGYLPIAIQRFLHTDNKKCRISSKNPNLKDNHPCLLRYGVEQSSNQSFIACVADCLTDPIDTPPTIIEMKRTLIEAMDLDRFMVIQNGTLIDVFDSEGNIDLNKYKNTRIYKNVDLKKTSELDFLKKVARSYENFCNYLRNDSVKIDYTYLWDLICMPNPKIFLKGRNLIILELKNNDVTDNVSLICPSNHYSLSFFDSRRKCIILLKIGNYFEPIYSLKKIDLEYRVGKAFSMTDPHILPNIKQVLELIKKSLNKCDPLQSQPKIYKFKQNIMLGELVKLLESKDFSIDSQVLNYNGRVIGVMVSKDKLNGFLPCFPSSPMVDLEADYIWMDDGEKIASSYKKTFDFLKKVYNMSKEKILCRPSFKIIEDEHIVGILTQTNQFVPVKPVQDTSVDDLEPMYRDNYAVIDKESITSKEVDNDRINYIRKIQLETQFFNVFRNTIRILLGEFKNRKIREKIEEIVASKSLYLTKLSKIDSLIRDLTKDIIIFPEDTDNIIDTVTTCYMGGEDCSSKPFCIASKDKEIGCKLVIPEKNLINGQDNEEVYNGRIADEILRYNRIRSFIFKPKVFLSFGNLKYNLRDNEIILLQSLLTQDYFEDLIQAPTNEFIKYNTYDTVEPLKTEAYSSAAKDYIASNIDEASTKCEKKLLDEIKGVWGRALPPDNKEIEYSNSPSICTFQVILDLIKHNDPSNIKLTKQNLKELLNIEYISLFEKGHQRAILETFKLQGKQNISNKIEQGLTSLGSEIMNNEYYLTELDLWILSRKFNIPLVLFSAWPIRETLVLGAAQKLLVAHSDGTNSFYFIRPPPFYERKKNPPKYNLVVTKEGKIEKIPLNALLSKPKIKEIQENIRPDALIKFLIDWGSRSAKEFQNKNPVPKIKKGGKKKIILK